MEEIQVKAHGKINLALDVLGKREDGYHEVEMVMAQIGLSDQVLLNYKEQPKRQHRGTPGLTIQLNTEEALQNRDNLAYRAARLMQDRFGQNRQGSLILSIEKRIPIAAGLAGGSADGAAVLHGINYLWNLNLSLKALCDLGEELGADVPFGLVSQAKSNPSLGLVHNPHAASCVLARGIGTDLSPLPNIGAWVVISTPEIAVNTGDVYQGIDEISIYGRKNIGKMVEGIHENNFGKILGNMYNVLELFTVKQYDEVMYTKNTMEQLGQDGKVLMSGSGPTIFFITENAQAAKKMARQMKAVNRRTFLTELC